MISILHSPFSILSSQFLCRIIVSMDNLLNKAIIFILCLGLMILTGFTTPVLIGMLVAISLTAVFELPGLPMWVQRACPLLYCLITLFVPNFIVFLPLAAGDLFRLRPLWLRAAWLVPILVILAMPNRLAWEWFYLIAVVCFCLLSCLLSWRAERIAKQQAAARSERDRLAQASYNLERRNRDLTQRQELELEVATLDERSRIAREIHDNVGHLLTRSILQVKALIVVHQGDEQLVGELGEVGETLDIAFETVRKSVHNLHEDASSLKTQLEALAKSEEHLAIVIDYRAEDVPARVAAAILAIVREALSNAQRHSDATKVQVSVVEFPGLYQLVIHDNGSVDPGEVSRARASGMGLISMEERARALDGVFRTTYDKGFKVLVSIPREDPDSPLVSIPREAQGNPSRTKVMQPDGTE